MLGQFALLADENIHPGVVAFLRATGIDVASVADDPSLAGSPDDFILQKAYEQQRVVLTHDADFGALAVAGFRPTIGIVFLRPGHIDPAFTIETLRYVLSRNIDLKPPFVLVAVREEGSIRVRVRQLG